MSIIINASVSRFRKKRLYLSVLALPFVLVNSPLCAHKSLITPAAYTAYEKQYIGIQNKPAFAIWTQLSKKISLSCQWTKNHPLLAAGAAALVLAPTAYYLYKKYYKSVPPTQPLQNSLALVPEQEQVPAPHTPNNLPITNTSSVTFEELDNDENHVQKTRVSTGPNTSFDSLFQKLNKQYNQTSPTNPFQKNLFHQQKLNLSTLCNVSKDNNACRNIFDVFTSLRSGKPFGKGMILFAHIKFLLGSNVKPRQCFDHKKLEKYKEVLKLPFFADPRLNLIIEILTTENPALISKDDDKINQVLAYTDLEEREATPFNTTGSLLITALSFNVFSLPEKFIQSKDQLKEVLRVINCMSLSHIHTCDIKIYDFLKILLQSTYFDIPQHQDIFFDVLSHLRAPLSLYKLALEKGCNPTTNETRDRVAVHLASENAETLDLGVNNGFINLWQPNKKGLLIIEDYDNPSQKALIKKKMFETRKAASQKPFATHTLFLTFPRDGSTIDDSLLIDVHTLLTKQFEPFITTQNFLSHSIQKIKKFDDLDFEKWWTCRSLGYRWVLVLPRWLIKNDTPSQIPSYFSRGAWTPTEQELEVGLFVDHWPKLSGKNITESFINKGFLATDKLIDKGLEYLNAPSGIKIFSGGFLHDPFQLSFLVCPQPISVILNNTLIVPKSCYKKNNPVPEWALFAYGHGDSEGLCILSTSIKSVSNLLGWLNKNTKTALMYISSCYSGSTKAQNLCGSNNYHFPLFFNTCFSTGAREHIANTIELLKKTPNFWKMLYPSPDISSLNTIPFVKEHNNGALQALPHKKIVTLESSFNKNKESYTITYTAKKKDKNVKRPFLVALNTKNITRPLILIEKNNYSHPQNKPINEIELDQIGEGIPLFISTVPGDCTHTIEHLEMPQVGASDFVKTFTYLEKNVDTKSYCFKSIYAIDDISNDQTQFDARYALTTLEKPYFSLFIKTYMEDVSILLVLHSPKGTAAWDNKKALDPNTINSQWLKLTGMKL